MERKNYSNTTGRALQMAVAVMAAMALVTVPATMATADNGPTDTDEEVGVAGEYGLDSGWETFYWFGTGTVEVTETYEFTNDQPVEVRVTDAFCYGDQFRIYDNGAPIADTSDPGSEDCGGPFNADAAYDDPDMSSGCAILAPGTHSISIEVTQNPFGSGAAYFKADTPANGDAVDCLQNYNPVLPTVPVPAP
jgi:hypothetical protein